MFKHYGLTGETVTLKPKHGESDAYPWGYAPQKAKITAEYPFLLVAVIEPHYHPHGMGISRPYDVCIKKHDILIGEMLINGGAIR